jgi:hypothetical protein
MMTILLPIILIAMLLIPAMALSSRFEKKRFLKLVDALLSLNEKLNLDFQKPELKFLPKEFPSLSGVYDGYELSIFIESTHKNKSLVIQLIAPRFDDLIFTIREQTSLDNIGIIAGEKDIETKDKAFDRKFFLSASNPDLIISLLHEDLRKFSLEQFSIFEKGIINYENDKLQYRHYSPLFVLNNIEKTMKIIEFLNMLGESITKII